MRRGSGLGAAVDHALEWGIDRIEATVAARADELRAMLRGAGFAVHDEGVRQCGIVTITSGAGEWPSGGLWEMLTAHGINSSVTLVGSSRTTCERRNLPPMLRLSVHYTTTTDELTETVEILSRQQPNA